jgi:predicted cupin superfamily sugar epimerase
MPTTTGLDTAEAAEARVPADSLAAHGASEADVLVSRRVSPWFDFADLELA